ncbi:MAG TPA: aryl-sulfate sulfotransferase, partial [Sutterella sp.]|nr:aryl-sulfate sulfotransferase [Sutterella sp.]
MNKFKTIAAVCAVACMTLTAQSALAAGGASGPAVKYAKQGQIGEVITNPYRIAPLTAIIRSGGYQLANVKVRIVPKANGTEVKYEVDRSELLTHGGIPVFGLYPDYVNTVEVSYTRIDAKGEKKDISETYKLYAPPVYTE